MTYPATTIDTPNKCSPEHLTGGGNEAVKGTVKKLSKKKLHDNRIRKILHLAEIRGILVRKLSKHDMNLMVDQKPHQGFILLASKLTFADVNSMPSDALVSSTCKDSGVSGETYPLRSRPK